MNYISLCDGIGAAHVAWKPLSWQCLGVSEINPFCNAVVEHHWGFENFGSLTEHETIEKIKKKKPDLIIGGTPCQSFSVAGRRRGLHDDNGKLILWFLNCVYRAKPKYFVWENVFGAFSVDKGTVLRAFVASLAEFGYMVEWRVLDAEFFGVPQVRRRVFVVGRRADVPGGREILFESEDVPGRVATRKKTKQNNQGAVAHCIRARGNLAHREDADTLIVSGPVTTGGGGISPERLGTCIAEKTAYTLRSRGDSGMRAGIDNFICETVTAKWAKGSGGPSGDECQNLIVAGTMVPRDMLAAGGDAAASGYMIAETVTSGARNVCKGGNNYGVVNPVIDGLRVRRITPIECERLQGFPDDYTLVPVKKYKNGKIKMASDTQRYIGIGNSMAVPVIRWIGERIGENENNKI